MNNRERLENLKNELRDVPRDEDVIRMYNESKEHMHERSFRSGDDANFKVTP